MDRTRGKALALEARSLKEELEQLAGELAAVPGEARDTLHARIVADRDRLEAIARAAEKALEDQREKHARRREALQSKLEGLGDELSRAEIEASKAEAEAAYEADRYELENARTVAKDGIELSFESMRV